jgi:hypothetical protein
MLHNFCSSDKVFHDPTRSDALKVRKGKTYRKYPSVFQHSVENVGVAIDKTASLMTPDRRACVSFLNFWSAKISP